MCSILLRAGELPVLYHGYQLQDDLVAPLRFLARTMMAFSAPGFGEAGANSGGTCARRWR